MSEPSRPVPPRVNRRASRRTPLRSTIKVECRKGAHGLGANLIQAPLDLSETGARLVLKVALPVGQEVEVLIQGGGFSCSLKRIARVVWRLPTDGGGHLTGLHFDGCVPYADLQALATPPRVLR